MSLTSPDAALDDSDEAEKLRQAHALEAVGKYREAYELYRELLERADDPSDIYARAGRFAMRVGESALAERWLLGHANGPNPRPDVIIDLARVQAGYGDVDQAEQTLRTATQDMPTEPRLWLERSVLLCERGRAAEAAAILEEALRFAPQSAIIRSALADAVLQGQGDIERALSFGAEARAVAQPDELPTVTAADARRRLSVGDLHEGWKAFVAGVAAGRAAAVTYRVAAPRWTIGRRELGQVILFGEEQLADEILLASLLPSVLTADAKFILALDNRLLPLAARSFPRARVAERRSRAFADRRQHAVALDTVQLHGGELVSAWIPLREFAPIRRATLEDFQPAEPYLKPDPARVAHWRQWLGTLGPGPKVGLQIHPDSERPPWEAPAPADLRAALGATDLCLIALGRRGPADSGWESPVAAPPDLAPDDLDDLAALAAALDAVVGPAGVATYLAGAVGARTFILAPQRHWAMLGSGAYPWFADARALRAAGPGDWDAAITELADALAALASR